MTSTLPFHIPYTSQLPCSFQQSGGRVVLGFERPLAASSDSANDGTNPIPLNGPVTFIVARGLSNDFSAPDNYHGGLRLFPLRPDGTSRG